MRHAPFAIGTAERDAWLAAMLAAVEESAAPEEVRPALRDYFTMASTPMINQPDEGPADRRVAGGSRRARRALAWAREQASREGSTRPASRRVRAPLARGRSAARPARAAVAGAAGAGRHPASAVCARRP